MEFDRRTGIVFARSELETRATAYPAQLNREPWRLNWIVDLIESKKTLYPKLWNLTFSELSLVIGNSPEYYSRVFAPSNTILQETGLNNQVEVTVNTQTFTGI